MNSLGDALKPPTEARQSGSYRSGGYVRRTGGRAGANRATYATLAAAEQVVLDGERGNVGAVPDGPPYQSVLKRN